MKKTDFMQIVNMAIDGKHEYMVVTILTSGSDAPEYIINPNANFQNKKEYYDRAYNENMILNTYDGIRIVDVFSGDLEHIKKAICGFENLRMSV